jgi:hypothetical protein
VEDDVEQILDIDGAGDPAETAQRQTEIRVRVKTAGVSSRFGTAIRSPRVGPVDNGGG